MHIKLKSKRSELDRLRKQADPRKKEPQLRVELQAAGDRAFSKARGASGLTSGHQLP